MIRDQLRTLIPVTHLITSGTGVYYPDYIFSVPTACNATVGATYTNNGQTFTVRAPVASSLMVIMSSASATLPTVSGTLTKATGTGDATITFDSMAYPIAYKVKMVGGGAGGSGSGSGGTGGAGDAAPLDRAQVSATEEPYEHTQKYGLHNHWEHNCGKIIGVK